MVFLKKYFSLFELEQKKALIVLFFLLSGSTIFELLGISSILLFLNAILDVEQSNFTTIKNVFENYFLFSNLGEINSLLFFLIVIFSVKFIFISIANWCEADFISNFHRKISNRIFENLIFRDYSSIIKDNSSVHIRNLTSETRQLNIFYDSVIKIFIDLFLIFAIFILLLFFNFKITVYSVAFFSIIALIYFSSVRTFLLKKGFERQILEGKKISNVSETIKSIKTIKILSKEYFFINDILNINKKIADLSLKVSFLNSFPKNLFEILLVLSFSLLFYFFILEGYNTQNILQILSIYFVAYLRIIPSANRILSKLQLIKFSYASFVKILEEIKKKKVNYKENNYKINFKKKLKITLSKFSYRNKNALLLKNIKIDINKGQSVGIFGKSGSGKSTLLNIICGFLDLKQAEILCDGVSIKRNIKSWQSIIGYIPQNIPILNNSLKSNLIFGKNDKKITDDYLLKIIKKANLKKFYKKRKTCLKEIISQDGLNISGGEIQRIGIARALVNNPEIIIMDESTSALDTLTENSILREIHKLKKTLIIVSHRLNTFKNCDVIFNLQDDGTLKRLKKNEN